MAKRRKVLRQRFEEVAAAAVLVNPTVWDQAKALAWLERAGRQLLRDPEVGSLSTGGLCLHRYDEIECTTLLATVSPVMIAADLRAGEVLGRVMRELGEDGGVSEPTLADARLALGMKPLPDLREITGKSVPAMVAGFAPKARNFDPTGEE